MFNDPRSENCRAFHVNADGKVDGVELTVIPYPPGRYAVAEVCLIDEAAAQGNVSAYAFVHDRNGQAVLGARVYLAWPWSGQPGDTTFEEHALPGNTNYPPNHPITNGYNPPRRGPLAIYVGTVDGAINSEVIAGLGLPFNRHVGYQILFKERVAAPVEAGLPEDEPVMTVGLLADKSRWWLEESIRQDEAGNAARAAAIRYSLVKLDDTGLFYRLENALKSGVLIG